MSYPKKVLQLRPSRGVAADVPPAELSLEFYSAVSNVHFREGFAQRIGGERAIYTQNTTNPVHHLLNVRAPGGLTESNFWLSFGVDNIDALETSNVDDVTGSALQSIVEPWEWSTTLLNNIPVATNGRDIPRYWAGDVGTGFADLPGWPAGTICKSIAAFKFHLFALDIDGPSGHFESQILWSDATAAGNVPSTWTAAATNEAGEAILADTPTPCMCAVPLQDTLLVFKRSSTYGVVYVGQPFIFSVRLLDGDRGALTRHAAIDVGGKVLVVCDGDVMLTDGTTWQSIAQGRVRNYLFSQLDQDNYESLYVVHHRAKQEVWICYPTTGSDYCNEAIVYNVATDSWGVRVLDENNCAAVGVVNDTAADASWDVDSETWDADSSFWNSANFSLASEQLVLGGNSASLMLQDSGDAVAVAASVTRQDLTFGNAMRFKYVRRVHVRSNATPGTLYVRIGTRNTTADSITWGSEQTLAAGDPFVNVRALGRFVSVQVRSEGADEWLLAGLDLEYEERGYV